MLLELETRFEAFGGMAELEEKDEEQARDLMLDLSSILAFLYPAFLIIELLLLVGAGLILVRLVGIFRGSKRKFFNFSMLRFPFYYVWILIFATGASLLASIAGADIQFRLWMNYLLLIGVGFFLQGLAVFRFVAARLNISPVFQIVLFTTGILLFFQVVAPLVTATGFADQFMDLRQRFKRSRDEQNESR